MEDFSAPSFSLGFDLEEEQDQGQEEEPLFRNPSTEIPEEDLDLETLDPDLELLEEEDPPPVFKRLRRGPPPPPPRPPPPASSVSGAEGKNDSELFSSLDDEIEDLSSQEQHRHLDQSPSLQSRASCSSSKFSLHCRGLLSSQSVTRSKAPKLSPASNASTLASFEASNNKNLFPTLTVSPLRKIHLLDSDSDDTSSIKGKVKDSKEVDASLQKRQSTPFQSSSRKGQKTFQSHKPQVESFWEDFNPKESSNLTTPVLDDFCEEYFRSAKNQKLNQHKENDRSFSSSKVFDADDSVNDFEGYYQQKNIPNKMEHNWDLSHPQPPAYHYFYHDDARIRTLIRERLPYFVPLGVENHRGTHQFGAENLDYMSQFSPTDGPSRVCGARVKASEGSSKIRGKRPSTANAKEASHPTGSWVNPRSNATIPKDAGKRRVSADDRQSGRWFTGQDGRKVYVTKNGQELTGRSAYKQYRKESGAGFQKGRKKAAVKRKKK